MFDLVMLIDDNETDVFLLKRLIEMNGYASQIETKNSAASALSHLASVHDVAELWPQLIFLDWAMPLEDGAFFLHELQKKFPEIYERSKIIALTTKEEEKQAIEARRANVLSVLQKPLTNEKLQHVGSKLLKL